MANKNTEKNIAKALPRVGGAFTVAMAVTMALSNQAYASEVVDTPAPAPEAAPVAEAPAPAPAAEAPAAVAPAEVPAVNESIAESNAETAGDNAEAAGGNAETVGSNSDAVAENTESTGGELAAPELPSLPDAPGASEAPEAPATEGLTTEQKNEQVDGYNDAVGQYNDKVAGYNDAAGNYNEAVDGYNTAAGKYDTQAQEDYRDYLEQKSDYASDWEKYLEECDRLEKEHNDEQDRLEQEHNDAEDQKVLEDQRKEAEALKEHNDEQDRLEQEHIANELEAAKKEHNDEQERIAEEYNAAELQKAKDLNDAEDKRVQAHNAAEAQKVAQDAIDQQNALDNYNEDKKEYEEAVKKEETVYQEVVDYNNGIEDKNADIEEQNAQLNKDVDTGVVENIDQVGELNKNVEVSDETMETLTKHEELAQKEAALLERGAALEADERRNSPLGSEAYAAYIAEVEAFNEAVDLHNLEVDAYNNAVSDYNDAVTDYNSTIDNSTTDNGYTDGDADWGNIQINSTWHGHTIEKTFGHIHVKYQAAASKDKTIGADGKPSYSETVTDFEVLGVYPSETDTDGYGVTYDNDGPGGSQSSNTVDMYKDEAYDEFGAATFGGNVAIKPSSGTVSFYVTLSDGTKEYDINVNLNDASTYSDGSFYKAETGYNEQGELIFTDTMASYRDSNGNPLDRVQIGGDWYYDISGKSVFVISALACDGTNAGYDGNIQISNISGLDLVLNLQTMIENHQSSFAQKLTQITYQLGKTAYAEHRTHETYEQKYGPFEYDPYVPDYIQPEYYNPKTYTPVEFDEENFVPTEYKREEFHYDKYQPTKYQRELFNAPKYEGTEDPGHKDAPTPTKQLEHVTLLERLEEMLYFVDEAPPAPEPIVINYVEEDEGPTVVRNLQKKIIIQDEKIPLAKAPNTGDLSGIWAAISGLSLGGITLLNRKRKEEE